MKKRSKSLAGSIAAAALAALVAASPVTLLAETDSQVPDTDGTPIELTVNMTDGDGETKTPIPGVHVAIYQVADLETKGGNAIYTPTAEYADVTVDGSPIVYESLDTVEKSQAAAAALAEAAKEKKPAAEKVTGNDGIADFTDQTLPYGMYLVMQTGREGKAAEMYAVITPYLLMLPGVDELAEGQEIHNWIYKIESVPKMGIDKVTPTPTTTPPPKNTTPPKPSKSVNTGDASPIMPLIWMIVAAAGVIAVVLIWYFKKGRHNKKK